MRPSFETDAMESSLDDHFAFDAEKSVTAWPDLSTPRTENFACRPETMVSESGSSDILARGACTAIVAVSVDRRAAATTSAVPMSGPRPLPQSRR